MAIKTFLLASLAIAAATTAIYLSFSAPVNNKTYLNSFMEHKKKYNKLHANREDLEYRYSVYVDNMKFIEEHNSKGKSYILGENQFSDLTFEEFSQKYLTQPIDNEVKLNHRSQLKDGQVDWVSQGKVSRVKNQQACGSCWAFSTIGALESAFAIQKNINVELSEQELVDCSSSYGNNGCNGGIMSLAFDYIQDNKVSTEKDYVYTAADDDCKAEEYTEKYGINSYNVIDPIDVTGLVTALEKQPVSVAIEVRRDFMHYTSGVYVSDSSCGNALNHGVLAVGYKNTGGESYFKVKNSWGSAWGESGFIRMAIGSGSGTCGIANETDVYPLVQ